MADSSKTRPPFLLQVAQSKEEVQACYDIRIEVFSVEQGFPLDTEIDEYDPYSIHFLLTTPVPSPPPVSTSSIPPSNPALEGTTHKPIGTIRFVPGKGKLTRLALDKEYRKYGLGKVLVQGMEEWVAENAVKEKLGEVVEEGGKRWLKIKCHSQLYVKPFYAKLGYVEEGPEFDEDGAPHQLMVHKLEIRG